MPATAIFYPSMNSSLPQSPCPKMPELHKTTSCHKQMMLAIFVYWFIFACTGAQQKMESGGQEVSLLCRVMGFQLFSRGAPSVPQLFSLPCLEAWSLPCSKESVPFSSRGGARTKANLPQSILCLKKPFISPHACRKVCDNTLAVWNVRGDESGPQPNMTIQT